MQCQGYNVKKTTQVILDLHSIINISIQVLSRKRRSIVVIIYCNSIALYVLRSIMETHAVCKRRSPFSNGLCNMKIGRTPGYGNMKAGRIRGYEQEMESE